MAVMTANTMNELKSVEQERNALGLKNSALDAENNELHKQIYYMEKESSDWKCLGEFRITYYCDCPICQGGFTGTTASGEIPIAGITISVDRSIISLGSTVKINGKEYIAHDTGGAIKGKRIDIFVESHDEAVRNGVDYEKVYIEVKGNEKDR